MRAECYFCGKTTDIEDAVEEGWLPSFYDTTGRDTGNPCCPQCWKTHLRLNGDDEHEIIPDREDA